jgi:DNA processing protein
VVTPACAAWPGQLDRLDGDAPLLLYVRGDPAALAARAVAVVGTRQPTAFGLACARRFGQRVAEAGCTVVSGLALGCDTAGHEGCLEAQGRTVAVLPGPVDRIIPYGNRHLATRITTQGGCLASEYPNDGLNPHDEVPVHQFVARDRIQAGLSRGVLVVETGAEDGTMHTVHAAQRMAVPIACLMRDDPAWLAAPGTAGNRQLVEAGQAAPLRTAEDLRAWLGQV